MKYAYHFTNGKLRNGDPVPKMPPVEASRIYISRLLQRPQPRGASGGCGGCGEVEHGNSKYVGGKSYGEVQHKSRRVLRNPPRKDAAACCICCTRHNADARGEGEFMNDEKTQAAVERLRMRTQLYAQTKTRIMPGTTSTIETLLVAEVRGKDVNLVLAALDAANERAERAEVALDMKIGTCIWIAEDEDSHYEGTCGVAWWLMDGDTKDHQVNFCPRCGGRVKESGQ